MKQTIVNKVKNRIYGHGRGWVFSSHDFSDLDSDTGVRSALSRLSAENLIQRVSQGIYVFPKMHDVLGPLSPSINEVAQVYANKNGAKIQPSGAYAANLLGFSDQVPGQVIFLTDGPAGNIKIKNLDIKFKKTTVKNMYAAGSPEALVIQAFKFMGQDNIDDYILAKADDFLKSTKTKKFFDNIKFAPRWIRVLLGNLTTSDI